MPTLDDTSFKHNLCNTIIISNCRDKHILKARVSWTHWEHVCSFWYPQYNNKIVKIIVYHCNFDKEYTLKFQLNYKCHYNFTGDTILLM
jgi:hypothetical protein